MTSLDLATSLVSICSISPHDWKESLVKYRIVIKYHTQKDSNQENLRFSCVNLLVHVRNSGQNANVHQEIIRSVACATRSFDLVTVVGFRKSCFSRSYRTRDTLTWKQQRCFAFSGILVLLMLPLDNYRLARDHASIILPLDQSQAKVQGQPR